MMKIGVLTSGADAPGMNACIRSIVRCAQASGHEVYGFYDGFRGLIEGRFTKLDSIGVAGTIPLGGSLLGIARLPEFKYEQIRKMAKTQLDKNGIECLIVIGGDGSYRGAIGLHDLGVKVIAIPATIDNNIPSSDHSIGFSTSLRSAVEAVDRLKDTSSGHQWCSIVEVTGNNCEDLALFTGLACGAEYVITKNAGFDKDKLLEELKQDHLEGRKHALVVVSEGLANVYALAKEIESYSGFECRSTILGYVLRGGSPTPEDRIRASRLGAYAVSLIDQKKFGYSVGLVKNEMVETPIKDSLNVTTKPNEELNNLLQKTK